VIGQTDPPPSTRRHFDALDTTDDHVRVDRRERLRGRARQGTNFCVSARARASSRGTGTREERRAPTPRAGGGWGFERWMMRAREG